MTVELFNISAFMFYMGPFLVFRYIERQEYAAYLATLEALRKADKAASITDALDASRTAYGDWKRATGLLQCSMMFLGIEIMGLGIYGVWSLAVYLWGMA